MLGKILINNMSLIKKILITIIIGIIIYFYNYQNVYIQNKISEETLLEKYKIKNSLLKNKFKEIKNKYLKLKPYENFYNMNIINKTEEMQISSLLYDLFKTLKNGNMISFKVFNIKMQSNKKYINRATFIVQIDKNLYGIELKKLKLVLNYFFNKYVGKYKLISLNIKKDNFQKVYLYLDIYKIPVKLERIDNEPTTKN